MSTYGIVVGVDFSEVSDRALVEAIRLARVHREAHLHVVHVATRREVSGAAGASKIERTENALEALPDRVWESVRRVGTELAGLADTTHVSVHVRLGEPAEAIQQVAVDYDADIIVVGTHDRRGVSKLLLGSVVQELLKEAHCPVLVARSNELGSLSKSDRVEPVPRASDHGAEPIERRGYTQTRLVSWTGGSSWWRAV